ncbi:unnamed protein product [Acanthoscelides obtectus]|uniref:Uncharacterized protein n=1 Tax=Acanthoscelides obtectus TaxID=200917 RepID=A0A9P0LCB9_ACAOB|nr:unnamed protein product [Acanthoscelides obtectus]CAK1671527.1 Ejaculatory bulb-specific protein 3 [Acanthoscelides obtectus]
MVLLPLIPTAISVFILISDHQRPVAADALRRVERTSGTYSTKYDNFDVAGVLASERLVKRYGDCLMERGPCPPEGKFLKEIIPDAIKTACSKCTAKQKEKAGFILQHLLLHHRKLFLELSDKYDPDAKARQQYGIDSDDEDYSDLEQA